MNSSDPLLVQKYWKVFGWALTKYLKCHLIRNKCPKSTGLYPTAAILTAVDGHQGVPTARATVEGDMRGYHL